MVSRPRCLEVSPVFRAVVLVTCPVACMCSAGSNAAHFLLLGILKDRWAFRLKTKQPVSANRSGACQPTSCTDLLAYLVSASAFYCLQKRLALSLAIFPDRSSQPWHLFCCSSRLAAWRSGLTGGLEVMRKSLSSVELVGECAQVSSMLATRSSWSFHHS